MLFTEIYIYLKPTHPPHPELSQAGSSKQTHLVKIVNKHIRIICLARDNLSDGHESINYPSMPVNQSLYCTDYDNFSDIDEWEESFSSINCENL